MEKELENVHLRTGKQLRVRIVYPPNVPVGTALKSRLRLPLCLPLPSFRTPLLPLLRKLPYRQATLRARSCESR